MCFASHDTLSAGWYIRRCRKIAILRWLAALLHTPFPVAFLCSAFRRFSGNPALLHHYDVLDRSRGLYPRRHATCCSELAILILGEGEAAASGYLGALRHF